MENLAYFSLSHASVYAMATIKSKKVTLIIRRSNMCTSLELHYDREDHSRLVLAQIWTEPRSSRVTGKAWRSRQERSGHKEGVPHHGSRDRIGNRTGRAIDAGGDPAP